MDQTTQLGDETIAEKDLVSWHRVAIVSSMVSFSIPTFLTGFDLFSQMAWRDAFIALCIGATLLTFIGGFMGWVGTVTRKNAYMLVRHGFGTKGAKLLNILFSISLIGWFGLNLDLFSASVITITSETINITPPAILIESIAGALMITTTLFGFSAINKLSLGLVPIMIAVSIAMLVGASKELSLTDLITHAPETSASISSGVSLIVGVIIIGAIILPDITRFCRQKRGGAYTAFWSYFVIQSLVVLIASYATVAFASNDILDILLALGIGSAVLVVVIAGSWILNSLNLYSAELAAADSLPTISNKTLTILLGILGTFAAFANILEYFVTFLSLLTAVFVPIAGIIAIDFLVFNKQKYIAKSTLTTSTNWAAISAWFFGALLMTIAQFTSIPTLTFVSALDGILLSAVLYFVFYRFVFSASAEHSG